VLTLDDLADFRIGHCRRPGVKADMNMAGGILGNKRKFVK